jgi:multiple sugar transport system ATP-binding protein
MGVRRLASVDLRGLTKRFGALAVVDNVSLKVDHGQLVCLLGPSGCGKTTTLRLICGLEQPDAGEILIDGKPVTGLPPREHNLGMVFQEYGLYPSMDVFGNLAYGLQARGGFSKHEIERRVDEAARKLGLESLLRQPITDLSGGEQQRVSLGRAMVKDADAYLFDEPLSNLDPKLRYRVRRDILAMHRDKSRPSVYVTHDQTEAFAMGDTIAVMSAGRLQQAGTAEELLENPANAFIAGFVGSPPMNLLSAELRNEDGTYLAQVEESALPLARHWNRALDGYHKDKVLLGIRPDALSVKTSNAYELNGHGTIAAEVVEIEPLIGEAVVRLRTPARSQLSAVFSAGEETAFATGDTIRLGVEPGRVRLFDADTEQALIP